MKKNVICLMFTMMLFSSINIMKTNAQVTIGEDTPPHSGAILELRSKGLLLSKSNLKNAKDFQLPGKMDEAAGMVIYNTNPNKENGLFGLGLYVWTESGWKLLEENKWSKTDCSKAPEIDSISGFRGTFSRGQIITATCVAKTSGNTLYTWTVPQGMIIASGQGTNKIELIGAETGTYKGNYLNCTVSNLCGGASSTAANSSVTVSGCPASLAQPDSIILSKMLKEKISNYDAINLNGTFIAEVPPVDGAVSYEWTLPKGLSGHSTSNKIEITGDSAGTYSFSVVAKNNYCTLSSVARSESVKVTSCTDAPPAPKRENLTLLVDDKPIIDNKIKISPNEMEIKVTGINGTNVVFYFNSSTNPGAIHTGTINIRDDFASIRVTFTDINTFTFSIRAANNCGLSDAVDLERIQIVY